MGDEVIIRFTPPRGGSVRVALRFPTPGVPDRNGDTWTEEAVERIKKQIAKEGTLVRFRDLVGEVEADPRVQADITVAVDPGVGTDFSAYRFYDREADTWTKGDTI